MKGNTKTPVFILSGMIAGIIVALLNTWIDTPSGQQHPMIFLLCSTTVAIYGVIIGFATGVIHQRKRQISNFVTRPEIFIPFSIVALTGSLEMRYLARARGVEFDAINFKPFIFGLTLFGLTWIIGTLLTYNNARSRFDWRPVRIICWMLPIILGAMVSFAGNFRGVLTTIQSNQLAASPVFAATRQALDRDGDGFASIICETECDCNDSDPNIHPGALDTPDNAIDEDCSGEDLNRPSPVKQQSHPSVDLAGLIEGSNILLISIDALRADRVHFNGYYRQTTPNLDRLAAQSVVFEHARAPGPSTRYSIPTLLTGRHFESLDLKFLGKWSRLLESNETFAEILQANGYRTRAFFPYFRFDERSGFSQGFDVWNTTTGRNATWDPTGDVVAEAGLDFLNELETEDSQAPWLVWLHFFDPHSAYISHEEFKSFGSTSSDRYDGEIFFADHHAGRVLDDLKRRGLWDETIIIVLSDHGEALDGIYEHGYSHHGFSLFDFELKVPLMVKYPGVKPIRIKQPVATADLAPTIVELAGIEVPHEIQSFSLVPYLNGKNPPHEPILSRIPGDSPQYALVDWPFKIVHIQQTNIYKLFNLKDDPHERKDLAKDDPQTKKRLAKKLALMRFDYSSKPSS